MTITKGERIINLQTAIEINIQIERTLAPTMAASGTDAIKLGIEALKKAKEYRQFGVVSVSDFLPGETEE